MITSKQSWFILKLMKELEEIDPEKYDTKWFIYSLIYASKGYNDYRTTKFEASKDIQTLLSEKEKYEA